MKFENIMYRILLSLLHISFHDHFKPVLFQKGVAQFVLFVSPEDLGPSREITSFNYQTLYLPKFRQSTCILICPEREPVYIAVIVKGSNA